MASYVDKVLQPGETVRYTGTLHWVIYLPGVALLAFAIVGALVMLVSPGAGRGAHIFSVIIGIAFVFGVLHLISAWVRQVATEIAVTSHRIIYKTGLVSRRSVEM